MYCGAVTRPHTLRGSLTMHSPFCPKGPGVDLRGHPSVIWPLTFDMGDLTQKGELDQPLWEFE